MVQPTQATERGETSSEYTPLGGFESKTTQNCLLETTLSALRRFFMCVLGGTILREQKFMISRWVQRSAIWTFFIPRDDTIQLWKLYRVVDMESVCLVYNRYTESRYTEYFRDRSVYISIHTDLNRYIYRFNGLILLFYSYKMLKITHL